MIQSELKMIAERLKKIWNKLRVVLGAIGLLLLSNLPVILLDSSRGLIPPQFKNGFLLLIAVLAGLIIWYCWRRAEKMDLKIWDPEILSWRGLGMVLAGYIAMVVCDSLALHLMNLQGIETSANQEAIQQLLVGVPFWLALLLTAVLPALAEEVIFRGYLYKKLFGKQVLAGLLFTSLVFGLMHGPTDWLSYFMYSFGGLILGYSYYKSGYLIYPVVIHLLNNGLATLAYYIFSG